MADKEDVLDYIVEQKIGANFASTYSHVAKYIEQGQKDLKKAEKTLRMGITYLASKEEFLSELRRLERDYESFERRVSSDHVKLVTKVMRRHFRDKDLYAREGSQRRHEEYKALQKTNKKVLDRCEERPDTFTETQKVIGGVPIYVDKDVRDEVIPKGKQQVEKLYSELKRLDRYAP